MQSLRLKIKGLYTNPSSLSEAPEGALDIAENIVIDEESVAQPRRGFDRLPGDLSSEAEKLFASQDGSFLAHDGTSVSSYDDATDTWTSLGSSTAPTNDVARFAEANGNIYWTSSAGVQKRFNSGIVAAGCPKGLTLEGSTTGGSGFLSNNKQVAYRVLWGYTDDADNLVVGAPSERTVVSYSGGTSADVSLTITIPDGVTTSYIYQVYRSAQFDTSIEPNDELFLVYEGSPTSGNITAGYVTITDSQPDDLTGATIYTASSQEGILQANDKPPYCLDVADFRGRMFYANVKRLQYVEATLIARLQLDDTVTINSVVYTAKASETIASAQFKFYNTGSIAQDIADTAKSLCKVVNRYSGNTTINAYYLSGYDDLPGKIAFEAVDYSVSAFSVTSSRTASWSGGGGVVLPITSTQDTAPNGICFSKPGIPEAVPTTNLLRVGSEAAPIRRILPLRDSLFVLKDDGVFRITGTDAASTVVEPFDTTARIIGPETAVVLNNQIFCLTDQGVVSITDTGVTVASRPIEDKLLAIFGPALQTIKDVAFGVAYETDRKYFLFLPEVSGDTEAQQALVYNFFTNTWTQWLFDASCGIVRPTDGKMYLSNPTNPWIYVERKEYSFRDHADYLAATTITNVSADGLTATLASGADLIGEGDCLYVSDSKFSIVTAIDVNASTVTLAFNGDLTTGAATIYSSIESKVRWIADTARNPGVAKQYVEADLMFKRQPLLGSEVIFTSDQSGSESTVEVSGTTPGLWGFFAWGSVPWGGDEAKRPVRVLVPRGKQRCTQISVAFSQSVAFSRYGIEGLNLVFEPMGGCEVSK